MHCLHSPVRSALLGTLALAAVACTVEPGQSSNYVTQEPEESCPAEEYTHRTDHMTAWLVACESEEHGQFYERLQEMEHPAEECSYRYQLMGERFDSKQEATSALDCNGDCLYYPTYSMWIDRCDQQWDIQVYQVPPEDWMPLDPIPPVEGCPDVYMAPTGKAYHSMEELEADPCPEPTE